MSMSSFSVAIPRLLFVLEAVQNKHGFLELHGVDVVTGAVGIVFDCGWLYQREECNLDSKAIFREDQEFYR